MGPGFESQRDHWKASEKSGAFSFYKSCSPTGSASRLMEQVDQGSCDDFKHIQEFFSALVDENNTALAQLKGDPNRQNVYISFMDTLNLEMKARIAALAREKLYSHLAETRQQLADLSSSSAEEDKSSAGDKYETQREMIKQSQDILDRQLSRIQLMMRHLAQIPITEMHQVQEGALVQLPIGLVWVGISLGKITDEEQEYLLISTDSPLFVAIKGLKEQQSTSFRGKTLTVEQLI